MKLTTLILTITSSSLLLGCSSLFYYPDRIQYVDTAKLAVQPELLRIPARDGHAIPAWHFKSLKGKPKALIIQYHGNAQNMTSHFVFLASAPAQGYDHLIFDYRGYGLSEGSPTPENTVSDGMDVLMWARKTFPETKIVVFGQSLGGAIALKSLIELKGKFKADVIVIDSSFSSYRSVARTALAKNWITWFLQPVGWLIVDNSMAPGKDISTLEPTPFLVVHGTHDPVVDFSHGERIFDLAPLPKDFWEIKQGGHTDFMFRPDIRKQFYEYLEANL